MTDRDRQAFAAWHATRRFGGLDGLRACAILAVIWHHGPFPYLPGADAVSQRGFLGVDLFFVLSGFLITALLLRERAARGQIALGAFYWRRSLRILPVYLLVVTALGAYNVIVQGQTQNAQLWPFYYLFLANFLTDHIPLLTPTWSLSVEEQFYLLWPLALVLLPVRALLPVLGAVIALNVAGATGVFRPLGIGPLTAGPLVFALPVATYAPILIGAALAVLLDGPRGHTALCRLVGGRWSAVLALALLAALVALAPADLTGLPYLALHLAMALLLAAVLLTPGGALTRALDWPPLARIGQISYGLYLYHLIALHIANAGLARLGWDSPAMVLISYAALSAIMAEISFRWFEAHFMRLRHLGPGRALA